ncbi:MAG: hypothetical protein ABW252_06625 [Polyangiales bacterium]
MTAPSDSPAGAPARLVRMGPGVWPVVRAALVTALVALWVLSALPSRPLDEARLARPTNARTVRSLQDALFAVGLDVRRADIEATLIALSTPIVAARNALVDPFAPALEFAQMGQRWGLFLQTGRTAYRVEIAARTEAGPFEVVYRPHEVDALGLGSTFAFRRLRGLYNPGAKGAPRAQFEGFVDYAAGEVFHARPAAVEVRVRMERLRLGTRDEPSRAVDIAHESVRMREEAPRG